MTGDMVQRQPDTNFLPSKGDPPVKERGGMGHADH